MITDQCADNRHDECFRMWCLCGCHDGEQLELPDELWAPLRPPRPVTVIDTRGLT